MLRRGVTVGVLVAVVCWVWLRMQRPAESATQTTIPLLVEPSAGLQQTTSAILHHIEATAPWILKVNEKSSIKL